MLIVNLECGGSTPLFLVPVRLVAVRLVVASL
jgi:hypothetical protein